MGDTLELSGLSDAERADLAARLEQAGVAYEIGPDAEPSVDEYGIIDGVVITLVLGGMAITAVGSWLAGHRRRVRVRARRRTDPDGTVTEEFVFDGSEFHGDSGIARTLAGMLKTPPPGAPPSGGGV